LLTGFDGAWDLVATFKLVSQHVEPVAMPARQFGFQIETTECRRATSQLPPEHPGDTVL
jgi:hypothetical protein